MIKRIYKKGYVLDFKQISELGNSGATVEDIRKRAKEVKELNDINFCQRMADLNITKLFNKNQILPHELEERNIRKMMQEMNIW